MSQSLHYVQYLPSYQARFQMLLDSEILLTCPLKKHDFCYDTFSLQKGWSYKKGNTVLKNITYTIKSALKGTSI
jgi:hypothetical protein